MKGAGSARLARAARIRGASACALAGLRRAVLGLSIMACLLSAAAGMLFPLAAWNGLLDAHAQVGGARQEAWRDPQWTDEEKRRLFELALAKGDVKAYGGRNGETVLAWRQPSEPGMRAKAGQRADADSSEILFRGSCALACAALALMFARWVRAAARRFAKAGGWGAKARQSLSNAFNREGKRFLRSLELRMGRCAKAAKPNMRQGEKRAAFCKALWSLSGAACMAANAFCTVAGLAVLMVLWSLWPAGWAAAALGPEPSEQKAEFFLWLGAAQAICFAGFGIWRSRAQKKLGIGYARQARGWFAKMAAAPGKGMARLGRKLDEMADRELMARSEGMEILENLEQGRAQAKPGRPKRL